jgi:hypothetical protein
MVKHLVVSYEYAACNITALHKVESWKVDRFSVYKFFELSVRHKHHYVIYVLYLPVFSVGYFECY